MSRVFEEIKESLTMQQVAEHFGYKVNRSGFILSPFGNERTPSCKLYCNSYYDFSTNAGGDLIQFTAVIIGTNNWDACQYLVEAFSLPISLSGHNDNREEIERRKKERQQLQEREHRYKIAWLEEVDRLQKRKTTYDRIMESKKYSPLSEIQAFLISEVQKISYQLDVLCGLIGSRTDREELLGLEGYIL